MNEQIENCIDKLCCEISDIEEKIYFLNKLNPEKPVTEEAWHKICETPLRYTDIMKILTKSIFPDAENIRLGSNYVYFTLYDFDVQIPTSLCNGINVNTTWYKKDKGLPKKRESTMEENMREYFKAVDANADWFQKAWWRIYDSYRYTRTQLFFLWFLKYRWKDDEREKWQRIFDATDKAYEIVVKEYHETRKNLHERAVYMYEVLLPTIETFSKEHYKYDHWVCGTGSSYSINEILKMEGLIDNENI